jgi:hypothetical protein
MVGERTQGPLIGLWGLVLVFLVIPAVRSPADLDRSGFRHVVTGGLASDVCLADGDGLPLFFDAILDRCDVRTRSFGIDSNAGARSVRRPDAARPIPAVPLRDWSRFGLAGPGCDWGIGFTSSREIGSLVVEFSGDDACSVVEDAGPCLPEHVLCSTHASAFIEDESVAGARPLPNAVALGCSGLTLVAYWRKRRQGGLAGL